MLVVTGATGALGRAVIEHRLARGSSRNGAFSRTDATLGRLIGRPPLDVKQALSKALEPA